MEAGVKADSKDAESAKPTLSKNALKRLKKKEEREKTKAEWRAKKRSQRKASRQRKIQECKKLGLPIPQRKRVHSTNPPSGSVIFDLSYDNTMTERELASLCSQIHRCYSLNRRFSVPFSLIATGFKGQVRAKIEKSFQEHSNWDMKFLEEDLTDYSSSLSKENMIYLSADAEEELESIDLETTYIIGGIVDRNRYKGMSLNRAQSNGLKCAKLPLGKYISLKTSTVLTVLHVFEILGGVREGKSWEDAIESVIPSRKLHVDGTKDIDSN